MHIPIIVTLLLVAAIIIVYKKQLPAPISTVGSTYEKDITEKQFDEMVLETSKRVPVVVDFYTDWCPPCRNMTPLLAEMAEEYKGAFFLAKINTDKNITLTAEYGVEEIPTVFLFVDGEPVEKFTGSKLAHNIRFTLAKHGILEPRGVA